VIYYPIAENYAPSVQNSSLWRTMFFTI